MEDYDRFQLYKEDMVVIDDSGKKISGQELIKYLKDKKKKMLTIEEELNIGDLVRLKGFIDVLTIMKKDNGIFKYGAKINESDESLYMFNQEDIEEVIKKR